MRIRRISYFFFLAILLWAWPAMASTYLVQRGDTLSGIAKAKGSSVRELARLNGIKKINFIRAGQPLTIPERNQQEVSILAGATGPYQHVYTREMGKPFSPRKNDAQQDLTGAEYLRHRDNMMNHGLSKAAAEDILSQKIRGQVPSKEFLPNGTIVPSVSFGENEVWTGGVLINLKNKPGLEVVEYTAGNGESIRDGWNCGNYIGAPAKPQISITPPPSRPIPPPRKPVEEEPCETCDDELEVDTGIYASASDLGGNTNTFALGAFGEVLYPWRNFRKDCSSEYWWVPGALASGYTYETPRLESKGWGGRVAGDFGLKRIWEKDGKSRQWVIKARPGLEYSHWENSQSGYEINQVGPVFGLYGEYRQEIIPGRLWGWVTAEGWLGFGSQRVSGNLSGVKAASRSFGEFLVGVDYLIAPRWILRGYAGFDYEGWSGEIPFVPGIELRHELSKKRGTVSVGAQAKIYTALNPTGMVYAKYENNTFVPRWYEGKRQKEVKLVGVGIGDNSLKDRAPTPKGESVSATPKTTSSHIMVTDGTNNSRYAKADRFGYVGTQSVYDH